MVFREQAAVTCTSCGWGAAPEEFEIRAEGPLCRRCSLAEDTRALEAQSAGRKLGASGRRLTFFLAVLPMLSWATCAAVPSNDVQTASAIVWLMAVPCALVASIFAFQAREPLAALAALASPFVSFVLALFVPGVDYSRGRALRRGGAPRVPPTTSSRDWLEVLAPGIDAPKDAADGWRVNAATETASVAAFSHLATELLALGAPASLVEKVHEDALDEIRHARLCYGLATAIDGQAMGPGPFPYAREPSDGKLTFASLAEDCVVESCLLEAASAHVAQLLAAREGVPQAIRGVLEQIAVDEARHALHGREIVVWCVEQGGADLVGRMQRRVASAKSAGGAGAVATDTLERFGLAGPRLWSEAIAHASREVDAMLEALCGAKAR